MVGTASRCCRNTWERNLNQFWSHEVAWNSRQSSIVLLKNSPWSQVSCKSDVFQIPSRVFSLLIQCLKYALEIWLGKISNAPRQLNPWATTTEPDWPRACDLHQEKHRIEKPVYCNYGVAQPATTRDILSSNEDLLQPKLKKIKKIKCGN